MRDFSGADGRERQPGQFRGAHDVLADHVALEVDAVANLRACCRFVCAIVYGTTCTSNRSAPRPATVRLMPSTAIEPFVHDVRRELRRES